MRRRHRHAGRQQLIWVDIEGHDLHVSNPASGADERASAVAGEALALWRGEPGRALQVLVLLASVAGALYFGRPLLRPRPAPDRPVGMPAYLELAPVGARLDAISRRLS